MENFQKRPTTFVPKNLGPCFFRVNHRCQSNTIREAAYLYAEFRFPHGFRSGFTVVEISVSSAPLLTWLVFTLSRIQRCLGVVGPIGDMSKG